MNYDGVDDESARDPSQSSRKQYDAVIEESKKVKNEMSKGISELRQFRN